jgi:hypothetical protein
LEDYKDDIINVKDWESHRRAAESVKEIPVHDEVDINAIGETDIETATSDYRKIAEQFTISPGVNRIVTIGRLRPKRYLVYYKRTEILC